VVLNARAEIGDDSVEMGQVKQGSRRMRN
jgi:hypothetical protein